MELITATFVPPLLISKLKFQSGKKNHFGDFELGCQNEGRPTLQGRGLAHGGAINCPLEV